VLKETQNQAGNDRKKSAYELNEAQLKITELLRKFAAEEKRWELKIKEFEEKSEEDLIDSRSLREHLEESQLAGKKLVEKLKLVELDLKKKQKITQKYEEVQSKISTLTGSLQELIKKQQEEKAKMEKAQLLHKQDEAKIEELRAALEDAQNADDQDQAKINKLEEDIKKTQNDLAKKGEEIEIQKTNFAEKSEESKSEIAKLKQTIKDTKVEVEKQQEIARKYEESQVKIAGLVRLLDNAKEELARKEKEEKAEMEKAQLRHKQDESKILELQKTLNDLNDADGNDHSKIKELKETIKKAQDELLDKQEKTQIEKEKLGEGYEKAKSKIVELEKTIKDITLEHQKEKTTTHEAESCHKRDEVSINKLEKENKALEDKLILINKITEGHSSGAHSNENHRHNSGHPKDHEQSVLTKFWNYWTGSSNDNKVNLNQMGEYNYDEVNLSGGEDGESYDY